MDQYKISRALISVSDKTNLETLAFQLHAKGVEIISSGGTRKFIEKLDIPVTPIEDVTKNPEAFAGRMKTLSFQVGSSLLFRRDNNQDLEEAKNLNIDAIDLVVCNLYPFEETLKKKATEAELIENIDIGGPTMIRAAAKNFNYVTVCTSPDCYTEFLDEFNQNDGKTRLEFRKKMACKAFELTAIYDSQIAAQFANLTNQTTSLLPLSLKEKKELRYGENPHQKAWSVSFCNAENKLASITPLQGKQLSYNNLLDADAAWSTLSDLNSTAGDKFCFVVVKHLNPCGMAIGENAIETFSQAWHGDPISSFGSIIALNREFSLEMAKFLDKKFVEVIIAPSFSTEAKQILASKKNLRLIELKINSKPKFDVRTIDGGILMQEKDNFLEKEFQSMTNISFEMDAQLISFGILTAKNLKSNAITLVNKTNNGYQLIGAGMGNPNRVVSIKQAVDKAIENGIQDFKNTVLISDAFFPFADSIELAHSFGIKNIIQPGGSIKDKEVINKCDELGISMSFTNTRHFLH